MGAPQLTEMSRPRQRMVMRLREELLEVLADAINPPLDGVRDQQLHALFTGPRGMR